MIKKIILISIIVALLLLTVIADKLNEKRCYNLPLNEFYKDNSCKKYVEKLGD